MRALVFVTLSLLFISSAQAFGPTLKLSRNIYREVPFSSQYSEDGALIRSVDFKSVNGLIPQIEYFFRNELAFQRLDDRNEAHITVITPPEGQSGFLPGRVGIDQVLPTRDMILKYKPTIQQTQFEVRCLGMQQNSKGNIVFYLIVRSADIMNIRREIENIVNQKPEKAVPFKAEENYYPHITIGYVGGDVHGVPKDKCVADIELF